MHTKIPQEFDTIGDWLCSMSPEELNAYLVVARMEGSSRETINTIRNLVEIYRNSHRDVLGRFLDRKNI
jgi:hypothetical protein